MPTNWRSDSWNPGLSLLTLVGAIVLLAVGQFAYLLYGLQAHLIDPRHVLDMPGNQMLLLQLAGWAPIVVYLLFLLPLLSKVSLADLGFRAPTMREIGIALVGTVAMAVVVTGSGSIISALLHRHDVEQSVALLDSLKTPGQRALFFMLACVFAPFYEELAFRAFVFNAMTRFLSIPLAAVLSGIFFGLLHVSSGGLEILTVGLPLVFGGIILAYVYALTKCFWANVLTHAAFNTIGVVGITFLHVN